MSFSQLTCALFPCSEDLSEAKMTYNAYVHQIDDIQQQLKDNEQELKVLEVKNENAKVAEEMMAAKVSKTDNKQSLPIADFFFFPKLITFQSLY